MQYTHLLYKRSSIRVDDSPDNHCLIATQDIPSKSLWILEHGLCAPLKNLKWIVMNNKTLYDSLYPRYDTFEMVIHDEHSRDKQAQISHNILM